MAYEVLRRIHLLHDQRGNDLSWGIFKPDHKWNNFEHNSQLPQTERKGRKSWRVLEDWMHGEPRWALLTVVTKKASGSCVAVCNSSFFERGYRTLPTEGFCLFVCLFFPSGPTHFNHHNAHFTPVEEPCSGSLKDWCCLSTLEGTWRKPSRPFVYMRTAVDWAHIKTEKIQKQVREDVVTIKYCVNSHAASKFWGGWHLGKARGYFLLPVTKVGKVDIERL